VEHDQDEKVLAAESPIIIHNPNVVGAESSGVGLVALLRREVAKLACHCTFQAETGTDASAPGFVPVKESKNLGTVYGVACGIGFEITRDPGGCLEFALSFDWRF
jgi:hypothetical protein